MKKISTLLIVILYSCMLAFLGGCADTASKGQIEAGVRAPSQAETEEEPVTADAKRDAGGEEAADQQPLYEVLSVNTTNSTIQLYSLGQKRQEAITYNDGTGFLNKYGDSMSIAELLPGRIVTITQSLKTKELMQVQITSGVWEYDDITRFSIEEDQNMIRIAGTKYYYETDLKVFSDENEIKLSDITDKDILRIIGIDRKILSVSVTSGHGTITLKNTELFEGGWLSIGTKVYLPVTKDMQVEMTEGTYLLSVANDGYGDSKEIVVTRGEETVVDLNELKGEGPKFCEVTFEVGVENAVMTIDGEKIDYTKPQKLKYGIHKLEIVAEGYDAWSKRLYVHTGEATIQVAMTSSSGSTEKAADTEKTTEKAGSTASTEKSSSSSKTGTAKSSTETETSKSKTNSEYYKALSEVIDTLTGSSSSSD